MKSTSKIKTTLFACITIFICFSLIVFPTASLQAALKGIAMWSEVVFPSLFPFFVITELMIGFGIVGFVGYLLDPLMRPLFRVPGEGGFVLAMGVASGFPAGAKFTARLRQENKLTAIEAERLVSFSNSSNPLFMSGAVAVGFFHNASLALILMASHYLGNLSVGFIMRYHSSKKEKKHKQLSNSSMPSFKKAFAIMHETRMKDDRPLGKLLGDAVQSAIQTLLMVGGFIIFFSVLNEVLTLAHFSELAASFLGIFLAILHIPVELSEALFSGMFEITLGSRLASEANASLFFQVMITSFILAFNGFSVHAQVASILAQAKIRFQPFFFARFLHGLFAMFFTFLLWNPLFASKTPGDTMTVFFHNDTIQTFSTGWNYLLTIGPFVTLFVLFYFILYKVAIEKR